MNNRRWEYDSMSFGATMTRVWVALYNLYTCIIGGAWRCGSDLLLPGGFLGGRGALFYGVALLLSLEDGCRFGMYIRE